ncbi:putative ABC transporter-binding protein precursor [bacterium BMS3Abin03]|nr:putative ABC transporter-binding protein precursor [bacterium BMS3Abin03]
MDKFNNNFSENISFPLKDKRWMIYILAIMAILVSLFFPSILFHNTFQNSPSIKKVYIAANNSEALKEIIKEFNEKNKGKIEVELVDFNYEKFSTNKKKELITRTMRSMNGKIDIFSIDQIWVPRIAKWSENLSEYFTDDDLSKLIKPALETSIYNGTLCSIPLFLDLGIMYYRKDLISKIDNYKNFEKRLSQGITWKELLNVSKQLNSKYSYVFQGKNYEGLICNFFEFVGEDLISNNANPFRSFNDSKIISKLMFMKNLIKNKVVPKEVLNFEEASSFRYAIKNDIPFFRGWSTIYKLVKISDEDTSKIKYLGIARLPKFESEKSVSTIGGWNLMVSKYSNVKKEAVKFIKFTMSREAQKILYTKGEYLPVIKSIYSDSLFISKHPRLKFYSALLKKIVRRPFIENYTRLSDILAFYIHASLANQLKAKDALLNAQIDINKSIKNQY